MPESGSGPREQAPIALEDTLFQESSNLGVVRVRFDGFERSSFEELIGGTRP